jgi:hypothetical protein
MDGLFPTRLPYSSLLAYYLLITRLNLEFARPNHLTDMDDQEILKIIQERLTRVYGKVVRIQRHDAPEWFGDGWLVSFELPTRNSDQMPVTRVAFFRNENGTPELARDIVVKDGNGKYPDLSWKSL